MSQSAIPQKRVLLYCILALTAIPLFFYLQAASWLEQLEGRKLVVENAYEQAHLKETKQALNKLVQKNFQNADHFYIEKHIETIQPLETEIEQLTQIVNYKGFTGDEALRKRLDFLSGSSSSSSGSNNLVFTEGSVQTYASFQETLETLAHPVEVDGADLMKILAKIEGVKIGPFAPGEGRPQLLITDFKIERKKTQATENFMLNLKVLKREFL